MERIQKRTLTKSRIRRITSDDVKKFGKNNAFVLFTVVAVIAGVILGFCLRKYQMSFRQVKYFSFPGELLMRMLQMMVMPLIISSLVTGMAALDSKATGKMGLRAVIYYTTTTVLAVITGIIMVLIIHPGGGGKDKMHREGKIEKVHSADAFMDLVRNMFPPNLVEACFKQFKTDYSTRKVTPVIVENGTLSPPMVISNVTQAVKLLLEATEELIPVPGSVNSVNALGLVVFSMSFGLVIGAMKEEGRALGEFFNCLNEAIMRLVAVITWYAPVGILFLIAGKIVEMEDMSIVGGQLGMYTVTVITGLLIHALVVLPALYFCITRKNPFVFIGGLMHALVTALGTSSSSATLPITFQCLEDKIGLDKRVTRFVLPVGATINMDGTALYEALAAIFIAQVNNFDLNFGQILTISITATAASIGAAGIPQAGLVTMVIVLTSVGLPTDDISLIIAVDWFLDRLRTTTNVLGDSLGAGIVEHLSRCELQDMDAEAEEQEMKKPYQLMGPDHENERAIGSETTM
ncbi:excitatory amino acid transporter 1-like isoform X2 [Hypanus sabinus]|uniref:excitatory amino acid transporter 1-like isoform X2 n=1 Tax=Hypanus sabinus TaxID=79690 RepID=UPI0028C38B26|nr:excitatory amino acid transporter 1-like isoform X2 [Hypanus sabinus]